MRVQYSTPPSLNPVSQPFISLFYVDVVDVYESSGDAPTDGYDDLKPPAYTASGRHLFSGCFSRALLVRKGAPSPQQLWEIASPSHNPQVRSTGGQ